ncbi:MAG TPA: PTS sugar transporter subunit IIA [Sphingomonadaceae bacterium]|jgi:PTS system nitrogen regulatory IIA component
MTSLFSLRPDAVGTIKAETKHQILELLAQRFAETYQLDAAEVLERLEERERLGSTGFGRGVAIPHARVTGIKRPVAALLRLAVPVEYDAADAMPVDLVFGLLSPENAGVAHLHALAAISRLVRDERMHEAFNSAKDADALYALLTNATDRDAA